VTEQHSVRLGSLVLTVADALFAILHASLVAMCSQYLTEQSTSSYAALSTH
jgi:hypothetical protein